MRVVLDTAVVVAALRSPDGASRLWLESVLQRQTRLLLSVPLALEYEAVLLRPEQLKATGLRAADILAVLDALCSVCEKVDLLYLWRPMVRDPNDEMVIETAFVGHAELLVTFNIKDFAGAEAIGIPVVTPGHAWHNMRTR
jgi:putative PIN family toxin of toxin-antitoxin system